MRRKAIIAATVALVCLITACDRSADNAASLSRQRYRTIVNDVLRLYISLHPLRSSQLALYSADSVLFTFSPDEIEKANREIELLLDAVSRIKPGHLDKAAVANLTYTIHWLKGERFAFEEIALHRHNPLLYCWIAEEALFGIPSRVEPPYAGERASYEARISQIPHLFSNATRLLENPAKPYAALAQDRATALRTALARLEGLLTERYGESAPSLDSVRSSLDAFSRFLDADLLQRAHGSVLIGSENLAKIFLYDECLTVDTSWMEREGKRFIKKLKKRAVAVRKRITDIQQASSSFAPQQSKLDSVLLAWERRGSPSGSSPRYSKPLPDSILLSHLEALERAAGGAERFGGPAAAVAVIVRDEIAIHRPLLPTNPYLVIPLPRSARLSTIPPSPFTAEPCRERIAYRPSVAAAGIDDHAYALLSVLSPVRDGERLPCIAADTIRAILSSETYRDAWTHMQLEDLINRFHKHRSEMELRLIEDDIRSIARSHVVLLLHTGTFTAASAIDYLMETIEGLSPDEAQSEYTLAAASPSIAYRGISLVITEDMLRQSALSRIGGPPRHRLRDLMRRHAGLPLSLIRESIVE